MKIFLFFLLLLPFSTTLAESVKNEPIKNIGFKQFTYADKVRDRPLFISLWYPTNDTTTTELMAENQVFYGFRAIKNAPADNQSRPLVILSHGYRGNWTNQSWLAEQLAHQGYIVAAVNHPGTTTFEHNAIQAAKLWLRANDISRVINALTSDATLAGKINPARIAAIGHSLGGWTVIALAGGRFSVKQFLSDCALYPDPHTCGLAKELGITENHQNMFNKHVADPRIKAIVSLDAGLVRGFTAESLAQITIPVLLIGAGVNIGDLPVDKESGYIATHLLKNQYHHYLVIPNATHFSFLPVCKQGAIALLEKDSSGDGIICQDRQRKDIHWLVIQKVIDFLNNAIPEQGHNKVSGG